MVTLRLKELLLEKGMTGVELAKRVGLKEETISAIVTGRNLPRIQNLEKIAKELNVDIKDLFNSTKTTEKTKDEIIREINELLNKLR